MLSTDTASSEPLTLETLLDAAEKIKLNRPAPVCPPHVTSATALRRAKAGETDGVTCTACGLFISR